MSKIKFLSLSTGWFKSIGLILIVINLCFANVQYQTATTTTTINPSLTLECRQQQSNCTDNIYPNLNDSRLMFPTNLEHVNDMCKMWSHFVDCIRRYISHCFEENRRQLFHKSVENSIDTVHAICSSKLYQKEYLSKANCFKQISIDYCGQQYQQLVNNIANPMANDENICCTYAQFKQCVNRPLLEECGRKAKNLMDHSMSFLISRCQHYTDNFNSQIECPSLSNIESKINSKIMINDENHHSNSIDSNSLIDDNHQSSSLPPPVYPESREWPAAESINLDSSNSNINPNSDMIKTIEQHNNQNKRELIEANIGNVHNTFVEDDDDDDEDNNDHHHNPNELPLIDPDMIIYTMKPESQIYQSSSATIILNYQWLNYIIIIISLIINTFFN
ncbi:uncharacterized protein LOC113792460 [Dermatophagoides pteronyssinus]|uniref:uncharacterized protein LOC113792460 n=1 Tax=Dermatophagoides pteronyssinus TaxID=6956 RepID=UPI003F672876